jgi:hypothetical protein
MNSQGSQEEKSLGKEERELGEKELKRPGQLSSQ